MAKAPTKAKTAGDKTQAEAVAAGSTTGDAAALGEVVADAVEEADKPTDDAAPEPTPAAPGDDAESVHERRVERLTRIAETAEFESGSLFGDIRDTMLDVARHQPALWQAMDSNQQRDLARRLEGIAKTILEKVVRVVAEEDLDTIAGTIQPGWNVKGEAVEIKVKIDHVDSDILTEIFKLAGQKIVITSADARAYMGKRGEVKIDPDQLGLSFADDTTPKAKPIPAAVDGDADLADGADRTHRVFDTDESLFLLPDGVNWGPDPKEAGAWTVSEAETIANEQQAETRLVSDDPVEDDGDDDADKEADPAD